jgi:protease-4
MKRGRYVLVILIIFFLLILSAFFSFLFLEFNRAPSVKAHSYLEMHLSGQIHEKAEADIFTSIFGIKPPLSLYDIWRNIQKAKYDSRIDSLVLRLGFLQCDWAKIEEIRQSILDFRSSGKKVYVYIGEVLDFDKEYYLASACDTIVLHPLGNLILNGIGGYVPFFKNSLDKLGIEAEFEQVEEYKTASHMFTEEGYTPAHREMMFSIYSHFFELYIKGAAAARNIPEETFRGLIDQAFFRAEKAKEYQLVDELLYEDEFLNLLNRGGPRKTRISHAQYTNITPSSLGLDRGKKIVLIYGMGPIHTGAGMYQTMGSASIAALIRRVRMDATAAALVFRIDSPGGSAIASDIIWREIALTKKIKPVVVSMSDVAGSGGYWVAMNADRIVAQPQTLTGSIGVVAGKFNLSGLMDKLGITSERVAFGKLADMFTVFRALTPEEKALLKEHILWMYKKFTSKVAEGRGLQEEEVDRLGKGRVWTGQQAKEVGLVDEMGGLSKAIELAKELAKIPASEGVRLEVWPKKASFLESIFRRSPIKTQEGWESALGNLLQIVQLFQDEKVLALMPFWKSPQ